MVCLEVVDPAKQWTLVITRPTTNKPPALLVNCQRERVRVPSV